jgi:hypothetical protein
MNIAVSEGVAVREFKLKQGHGLRRDRLVAIRGVAWLCHAVRAGDGSRLLPIPAARDGHSLILVDRSSLLLQAERSADSRETCDCGPGSAGGSWIFPG